MVIGTRPEAIKLAPIVLALRGQPGLLPVVVTTGQHTEAVREVLDIFAIAADVDLAVGEAGSGLAEIAAAVLSRFAALARSEQPDAVLVQGDTTSALGAALGAFYQRIPVAHVEAGLRSGDRHAPFPEEIHRRMASLACDLHFAPTPSAAARLVAEGIDPDMVYLTGNTVVDALRIIRRHVGYRDARLARIGARWAASGRRVLLVTAHRRESWGEPMERIAAAVERIARDRPGLTVVVVTHPNPRARLPFGRLAGLANVLLTEPEPYGSFVRLMELADLILTDSGGIQEEAPCLGTPVLVLRDVTERTEGLAAGAARLVGTGTDRIVAEAGALLDDPAALAAMVSRGDLYGDGAAAARCVSVLAAHLGVAVAS
ncbi:MAG TPA: UDP-N-acetylglucosamine 2-epimerase (non-hydrolyzing) [Streptosporangiaceae bacterium]|nr:UDP-N-acetylglucosamine 2-epimerase (non-hydrolyzing) [Streptosporangiaceae bacterium]